MQSISVDTETMEWMPATPFYGPNASFAGKDIVQLKVLSDRREEGGGIAWLVRFTPRKPGSRWSQLNRTRATELVAEGRMRPPGLAQIAAAQADGRWDRAYAPASTAEAPPDLVAALAANPKAAAFFATLAGANRYAILYRIGAAKKPETRARKIAQFVDMLERGETIHG